MYETCADCRHCNKDGYCELKEKYVNSNSSCPEFEEN